MTGDECARLVNRLTATWPAGVRGFIWTETLGDLEYPLADAAYHQLRDTSERPPSVAQFQAAYRSARTATKTVTNDPPAVCQICDGTGWRDAPPLTELVNGQAHSYTQVQPCDCTTGQRMRPAHATILEQNRRP